MAIETPGGIIFPPADDEKEAELYKLLTDYFLKFSQTFVGIDTLFVDSETHIADKANPHEVNLLQLTDTPSDYSGYEGYALLVNSTEDAVEFQEVVLLTNNQTIDGIKTFSEILVLPASNPSTDNQATRKKYVDDKFATDSGHDHDGTDSKKVVATNLDMTGITDTHVLYNNGGTLSGKTVESYANYSDGTATETVLGSTEKSTTTHAEYVKFAEFTVMHRAGTISVKTNAKKSIDAGNASIRVYIDGEANGSEQAVSSTTYVDHTETGISVAKGEKVQLYGKSQNGGTLYVQTVTIMCANPTVPYGTWAL